MSEAPWRDEDNLRELYHGEGMTYEEIADLLDCSASVVGKWAQRFGIEARDTNKPAHTKLVDADALREMYVGRDMTCEEIAKELGCTDRSVLNWLEKHDIERRAATWREPPFDLDNPWNDENTLQRLYVEEGLTQKQVAGRLGCSRSAVQENLDKFGIKTRCYLDYERQKPAEYAVRDYPVWRSQSGGERSLVTVHQLLAIAEGHDPYRVFSDDWGVHHISHLKIDNRADNLAVLTNSMYTRLHRRLEKIDHITWDRVYELSRLAETLCTDPAQHRESFAEIVAEAFEQ